MTTKQERFSVLSLYTGAGGLDQGFERTGRFVTRACVEMEPTFATTLLRNQANGFVSKADIYQTAVSDIDPRKVIEHSFKGAKPDGIIGGPPCQGFSIRGKRLGFADRRSDETFRFVDLVVRLRPNFFLMENVPRMLDLDNGKILAFIHDAGVRCGYTVSHAILNAADYGCATKRRRVFIVGFLDEVQFHFPTTTHSADASFGLKEHVGSGSVLTGLPSPAYAEPGVPQGHVAIRHTQAVIERFAKLRPGEQCVVRRRTRLDPEKPSPTLMAGNLNGIRSHIHSFEARELTNRESARLHGFTDDFEFSGNHAAMGVQIANSVPIPLATCLARQIAIALDGRLSCNSERPPL